MGRDSMGPDSMGPDSIGPDSIGRDSIEVNSGAEPEFMNRSFLSAKALQTEA